MVKRSKLDIQQERQETIIAAQNEYFGNITKGEAIEVFKVLSVLAQFPGAKPPEPLTDHDGEHLTFVTPKSGFYIKLF